MTWFVLLLMIFLLIRIKKKGFSLKLKLMFLLNSSAYTALLRMCDQQEINPQRSRSSWKSRKCPLLPDYCHWLMFSAEWVEFYLSGRVRYEQYISKLIFVIIKYDYSTQYQVLICFPGWYSHLFLHIAL